MLAELDETLHAAGIELCFAEMKDPGQGQAQALRPVLRVSARRCSFATVGEAVSGYLDDFPVEWVDWTDRSPVNQRD